MKWGWREVGEWIGWRTDKRRQQWRERPGEAEGEAQASGLDNWVNVIRFLRCGIQREKGMCGREDLRIRDGQCFSQGDLAP